MILKIGAFVGGVLVTLLTWPVTCMFVRWLRGYTVTAPLDYWGDVLVMATGLAAACAIIVQVALQLIALRLIGYAVLSDR